MRMLSVSLLSLVLALLSASIIHAVPLPSDCTCGNSPLSARTVDYIFQVTKARHLTPEECAFLCNPSPHRQQQTIISADSKLPTDPFKPSIGASSATSSNTPSTDSTPQAANFAPRTTASSLPPSSQSDSPTEAEPPVILELPAHRKDRFRPRPTPIPSDHRTGQAAHSRAQSTMSPHGKALLPCVLRVGGSLVLLFIIAVCVVELGDAVVLLYRR